MNPDMLINNFYMKRLIVDFIQNMFSAFVYGILFMSLCIDMVLNSAM